MEANVHQDVNQNVNQRQNQEVKQTKSEPEEQSKGQRSELKIDKKVTNIARLLGSPKGDNLNMILAVNLEPD